MIKEKEVEVKLCPINIRQFLNLGYNLEQEEVYTKDKKQKYLRYKPFAVIKVEDLPKTCGVKITTVCDFCGKETENVPYNLHRLAIDRTGNYVCKDCIGTKISESLKKIYNDHGDEIIKHRELTCMEIYGTKSPMQNEEIHKKAEMTVLSRFGVCNISQSEEIKEQKKNTTRLHYGYDNPNQCPEVQNIKKETLQRKLGVSYPMQSEIVKNKARITLYNNSTGVCSTQQMYLHNLYGGLLNYPFNSYSLDIAFPELMICIEYDGQGHNLQVKLGNTSQEEFNRKEIIRSDILRRNGWRQIHIISKTDKLPSDEILLQMLDISKQYFKDYPNHSWFEWSIDDGIYRNAEHKDGVLFNYKELRYIKAEDIQGNLQSFKTA